MIESWKNIIIASDQTHHILDNKPFYKNRFIAVLKYHSPGIAPVFDKSGAYHIDMNGDEIYPKRYLRTFGFYNKRAAVISEAGWFHILANGQELYSEHYSWCGNFQNGACSIRDFAGYYFHIDLDGKSLYKQKYYYAGDFKDNIAVVQNEAGLYTHIYFDGSKVHDRWFSDLDVFHKNLARAKDDHGWHHINMQGEAVYPQYYKMIEPFYNGYARVEDEWGSLLIIDESGVIIKTLKNPTQTPLQQLSGDLVGYWKTQTIKSAVEFKIFEYLPADENLLCKKTKLDISMLSRLLRALNELNLIAKIKKIWQPTEKGEILKIGHPLSLADAALHWSTEHYLAWMSLTDSLRTNQPLYSQKMGKPLFDWLDDHSDILKRYQAAMDIYAKHDYYEIADKIDLSRHKKVIDAGGGQGTLLKNILLKNNHLEGVLLERPTIIKNLNNVNFSRNFSMLEFDLFQKWPARADAIFLARVLHDWDDKQSTLILKRAYESLLPKGAIYLVELILDESSGNGGMLDLNMLVITGGSERTKTQFESLADSAKLKITNIAYLNGISSIMVLEKRE
jgi:hypothetical protein